MIRLRRWVMSVVATIYALFHAILGLLWLNRYQNGSAAVASLAIYLIVVVMTIVMYRGVRIPVAQAILSVTLALTIPPLAQSQLTAEHFDDYSTWYVLGLATIMSAISIRGYTVLAWIGTFIFTCEVLAWAGWGNFFASGLLGGIMLVIGTSVINVGLERASDEAKQYEQLNAETVARSAAMVAAGEQRSKLLKVTLTRAEPMLHVIATGSALTEGQRLEARILEASLRDEIRGGDLMAPSTRGAVEAARRRGVQVSMLDEGGLACLAEAQREPLWLKIAEVIAGIESGRVTVRSPIGERWVVTIAAFSEGENRPQVWLRLAADGTELS
jgi:hypothetical protein